MTIDTFISWFLEIPGLKRKQVLPSTRLFHDLGIDGDDVLEIMLPYEKKYGVDLTDFAFSRYFGSEFGAGWRYWFHKSTSFRFCRFQPLTIQDLYNGALQKKLR